MELAEGIEHERGGGGTDHRGAARAMAAAKPSRRGAIKRCYVASAGSCRAYTARRH
jgi:hypothetical protein